MECFQKENGRGKIHIIDRSQHDFDFLYGYCGQEACGFFFSDYKFFVHRKLHPNSPKREKFCKMCLKVQDKV